ncbi:alkaline phosphatase-like protein [Ramicandelaber brevisporus]|nr:alkaline phosphatase-like protein [Ramicandelaber brevisporus]
MCVSDGFGPASQAYARQFAQERRGLGPTGMTSLDKLLVGSVRTRSASNLITDSAAGATAYSCGRKTYNEGVGVGADGKPCGTVLEAAHRAGYRTGLVVTAPITDATPAAFSSHAAFRWDEDLIAQYQIGNYTLGRSVDLMFGGGMCAYKPQSVLGSCRKDERNLFDEARDNYGWTVSNGRAGFDALSTRDGHVNTQKAKLPLMSLFADKSLAFDVDRNPASEPALHEMAAKALAILDQATRDDPDSKGFFLMIEGSRIDSAAHVNDAVAHVHEILAYHKMIQVVRDYVDAHSEDTVMVSTSDHETGGVTLGRQVGPNYPEYAWRPEVIDRVQNSTGAISNAIMHDSDDRDEEQDSVLLRFLREVVIDKWLGIEDVTASELFRLVQASTGADLQDVLRDIISERAKIGWTTHGHTAVDVNLYAHGVNADRLRGNHENTDVGQFIAEQLELDLDAITELIKDEPVRPNRPAVDSFQPDSIEHIYHNLY